MDSFDTPEKVRECISAAKVLGMDCFGVGGAPHTTAEDIDTLRRIYRQANAIGEPEGIRFYYHNHDEEFKIELDGQKVEDLIAEDAWLEIDTYSRTVHRDGQAIALTKKEFDLLLLFARNPNIALYRETIYERVWESDEMGDTRTVDLHIQRLRKKVGWEKELKAVYKVGYRLEV